MNSTRLVLILALFTSPVWGEDSVIDQMYGQRNYELADAYWAAGQRFADLGQADRGAEFKARALKLFPGFVPGQAPAQTAPRTPEAAPVLPAVTEVREQNVQGQKIARLQFQKLLRGYLTGSAATVGSVLAPSVTFQTFVSTISPDAVASFLTAHPAAAGTPDDLFQLDSLSIADGAGQTVVLTVSPNPESGLADVMPFWKGNQTYTFDRFGDTWKLVSAVGN